MVSKRKRRIVRKREVRKLKANLSLSARSHVAKVHSDKQGQRARRHLTSHTSTLQFARHQPLDLSTSKYQPTSCSFLPPSLNPFSHPPPNKNSNQEEKNQCHKPQLSPSHHHRSLRVCTRAVAPVSLEEDPTTPRV
jgi:hypothetical protein